MICLARAVMFSLLVLFIQARLHGQSSTESAESADVALSTTQADTAVGGAKLIEFPIVGGSIDGELFYQQVVSKLHWTTELTSTLAKELVVKQIGVGNRLSVDSLRVLCNLWPEAFQLVGDNSASPDAPAHFRVDMAELETKWKNQKLSLRKWLASRQHCPLYELCGHVGFNGRSELKRMVIVLAGLHGDAQSAIEYAKVLNARCGVAACAFLYPNDAPIAESADYLHRTLVTLRAQAPNRRVILVTHSMGGLVARSVIEQLADKDPNCLGVTQLIAISPPNQGSIFAEYAGLLEVGEVVQRLFQGQGKGQKLFSAIIDGFNEAPADLVPGSEYLQRLAKTGRHPAVRYTIVAGDAGMIGDGLRSLGNELLELIASRTSQARSLQERARKLLNSPEFQKGTGDGVVTLQSASLDGVKDVVVLPVNHLDWIALDSTEGKNILQVVVERIGVEM